MNIIKQVYYLTEPVLTSHVQQKRSNQFTYILPITHSILSAVICEQSVPRKELNFCIENLLIKKWSVICRPNWKSTKLLSYLQTSRSFEHITVIALRSDCACFKKPSIALNQRQKRLQWNSIAFRKTLSKNLLWPDLNSIRMKQLWDV